MGKGFVDSPGISTRLKYWAGLRVRLVRHWQLYMFLILPVAYIVIFCYIPMYGVTLAFKDYRILDGIWRSPWAGTKYFEQFFRSPNFTRLLSNTLILSLYSLVAGFPAPILLALALNDIKGRTFKKFVQMVTYAPYFISMVVLVGMVMTLMTPRIGILNNLAEMFLGKQVNLLGDSKLFRSTYVFSGIWQSAGYGAIIYIAALAGIDQSLYEAARIDGASRFQKMKYIDIPGIMPTIVIMFILSLGGIMGIGAEKAYLLQNPLNLGTSEIIATYVYKIGLISGQYSFSTAVGLFNSVVNFTLLVIVNTISRRLSETSLW